MRNPLRRPNSEQATEYGVRLPANPSNDERILSPNQVAKIMSVTGEAVKQWIFRQKLPAVKHTNGYWKIKVSDFEAFLKARATLRKRRVLVTDSNNGQMHDVVEVVKQLGFEAIITRNDTDALLKSIDQYPALFIINIRNKETNPWRLADKIRATRSIRKTPILLITADDLTDTDVARAIEISAASFLKLPAEKDVLMAEISRVLD